jgi:hypothetical protein
MGVLDVIARFREIQMGGLLAAVASFATFGDAVADTAVATAYTTIVSPMTVAEVSQLRFGTVWFHGSAGTVAISPGGKLSLLGVEVADQDEAASASIKMVGSYGQTYTISLPRTMTFGIGENIVEVTGFTHDAGATPTLDPDGYGRFNIGATLILREGRLPVGNYAANLRVVVSNN